MPARTPELSRPPLVGLRRPHRGRRQSGGVIRRLPPSRVRRVTRTRSDDTTVTSYQERLDRSAPTYNITAIPVRELEQGITNETENPSPQSAPASPKNERETMTDQCTSSLRDCSSTVELVPCETDPAPDYDAPAVPDYHEASLGVPGYTITPLHMSSCQPQTDLCSYQNMCRLPEPTECLPTPFYVQSSRRRRRHGRRNRHRNRRRRHYTQQQQDDGPLKPCCSLLGCKICMSMCLEFRKVLIFLASVGVACILIGVVLGVLRSPGNSFLTLALMFVGKSPLVLLQFYFQSSLISLLMGIFGPFYGFNLELQDFSRWATLYFLNDIFEARAKIQLPPLGVYFSYCAVSQESKLLVIYTSVALSTHDSRCAV